MDIEPTFKGYVENEQDALLIIQATIEGKLKHIARRPYEIERPYLIVSGNVFVFIEEISGIKRWTDGVAWSPSRITGKFLIYKESDKNATGANKDDTKINVPSLVNPQAAAATAVDNESSGGSSGNSKGSTIKPNGLQKKTISVKLKGQTGYNPIENIHLVSYYSEEDVEEHRLLIPRESEYIFKNVHPSMELVRAMENITLGNIKGSGSPSNKIQRKRLHSKSLSNNSELMDSNGAPQGENGIHPDNNQMQPTYLNTYLAQRNRYPQYTTAPYLSNGSAYSYADYIPAPPPPHPNVNGNLMSNYQYPPYFIPTNSHFVNQPSHPLPPNSTSNTISLPSTASSQSIFDSDSSTTAPMTTTTTTMLPPTYYPVTEAIPELHSSAVNNTNNNLTQQQQQHTNGMNGYQAYSTNIPYLTNQSQLYNRNVSETTLIPANDYPTSNNNNNTNNNNNNTYSHSSNNINYSTTAGHVLQHVNQSHLNNEQKQNYPQSNNNSNDTHNNSNSNSNSSNDSTMYIAHNDHTHQQQQQQQGYFPGFRNYGFTVPQSSNIPSLYQQQLQKHVRHPTGSSTYTYSSSSNSTQGVNTQSSNTSGTNENEGDNENDKISITATNSSTDISENSNSTGLTNGGFSIIGN
ncbi:hypothetical protein NCAS_0E01700 [Naumovozyma castellii]|uniref:Uncharacterized protein n=1 Tax=Naumovozyma castellii TaxID=27288 RepID=G0VFH4_NAUCA|nr:hypothetical protein NCAS_0E01700 [Naumovozyma castellii CBS 4309]CCC70240.1 hypothetical protein NCAS_0E01700 [Naumovozyma castellii CBS 4309]